MSQKDSKFQSKGKKFGGKGPGKFGGGKKPAGRGFGKKFEGDKPARGSFGDRKPFKKRDGDSDRPARSFGERKPRAYDNDKPRRAFDGDRKAPFKKRFDDDKPRRSFDGDKPRRSFADGDRKPAFKKRFDDDKPRRSFGDGDRKPFQKRGRMDGTDRAFADARPRNPNEVMPERRPRPEKPFRSRDSGNTKPYQRSFDDRKGKKTFQKRDRDDRASVPRSFEEASPETKTRLKSGRTSFGAPSANFIFGTHPVTAALSNPKRVMKRLLVTETGFENISEAYEEAVSMGINVPEPTYVEREDIERLVPRDAVHQDVLLDAQPVEETFLTDIINAADDNTKIVILDQVTDPHNVGAILRSASAFGAAAVVAQKLHAPEITGTLAKSASGAAEFVPLVRETNLSRAIEQLKDAGFTCLGLDERGRQTIAEFIASSKNAGKGKVALVMGAEGDGLRRLVAENCDALVKLPTEGPIASLNVSNAAAVALYELIRK